MPDLHIDAVHAFWDSYDRQTLYRIVVALERVENWVVDKLPKIEPKILHLGQTIEDAEEFDIMDEAQVVRVLANCCSTRSMRILQALDALQPGTASKILTYAEESSKEDESSRVDKYAKLFIRRNLVFERLQLLSRVMSPQRISLVLKALGRNNEI